MPRKGRARRFREARELKQGYDDGLFTESGRSLADLELDDEADESDDDDLDDWDDDDEDDPLDDDPLRDDDAGRRAAS